MTEELNKKMTDYYTKYYRDDCCLKDYKKRAHRRLEEENNEDKRIKRLLKYGINFSHKEICLVGAGTGGLAIILKEKYNSTPYGLEPNKEGLSIIKDKCVLNNINPNNFKSDKAENISFPDNKFDLTYCHTVIEHVDSIEKTLKEMIRITKPGGLIYINTPNYTYPYEGHYKIYFPTFLPKTLGYIYLLTRRKSPKFLKTINFITEKKLNSLLLTEEKIISWQRIYEPIKKKPGIKRWPLNYLIFKKGVYPDQEIIIYKK